MAVVEFGTVAEDLPALLAQLHAYREQQSLEALTRNVMELALAQDRPAHEVAWSCVVTVETHNRLPWECAEA